MPARFRAAGAHASGGDEDKGPSDSRAGSRYLPWLLMTSWRECVGPRRKDIPMTQHKDRKQAIRARMAATGEPYTAAARAISSRAAGTDDDFVADRHADLDAGENGGAMTDADYYDRISGWTEAGRRCPDCGGRGWKRTPDSEDYNCRTCDGEGYVTTADLGGPAALAWSGPDWYAFPPEPPQGTGLGLGNGRNQRYYWEVRRRWAPQQVRQHARMAAELTGGRARHLADWYPEGWAPYHGSTRDLALELLYVITLHDWPDLVPDPARLSALTAAGDPAPVDAAFAEFDRHARLLTDDGLHPPTGELVGQATSILQQQAASTSWRERENAMRVLAQIGRAMTPYDHDDDGNPRMTGISMPGALATLDAMLCSSQGGFPPATVVSYRDRRARVLAEVQRCVWEPVGGPPARYALAWSRASPDDGIGTRQEEIVPAWEVELPPGTAASWLASP